jgi:DNA-binding winged helix-turn-helix (wHTH) protein
LLHESNNNPGPGQTSILKDDSKSTMKEKVTRYYLFGVFRLDVTERQLWGSAGVVPLTPKAFDTLLMLVVESGHVLSKAELMERVWPDSFVEENNLAQNIFMLRKALGQSQEEKFIETVPKRGYRFVAQVTESSEGAEGRLETVSHNKMHAGYDERQHKRGKTFLRDVVIIGRAILFS